MTPLREELAGKTHTTVVVMLAASAALLLIVGTLCLGGLGALLRWRQGRKTATAIA